MPGSVLAALRPHFLKPTCKQSVRNYFGGMIKNKHPMVDMVVIVEAVPIKS